MNARNLLTRASALEQVAARGFKSKNLDDCIQSSDSQAIYQLRIGVLWIGERQDEK